MSTIIDELIVRLGLKNDISGQAPRVRKDLDDVGKSAQGAESDVKNLGETSKDTAEAFTFISGKLASFLALIGGTYAIKSFVTDTIKTNTQVYFLARNLGISVQSLSAWGTVAQEFGGTAQGLQGTLSHLSMEATNFALRGQSSLIPFLSMMRVGFDQLHPEKMLLAIAAWVQTVTKAGASRPVIHNILEQMGIDEGTINAMFAGTQALQSYLAAAHKVAPTEKEAADAAKMNAQIVMMDAQLRKIGTDLLEKATPSLEKFFDLTTRFGAWVQANKAIWSALGTGAHLAGDAFDYLGKKIETVIGYFKWIDAEAAKHPTIMKWLGTPAGIEQAGRAIKNDFASRPFNRAMIPQMEKAIERQEGFGVEGSVPQRANNPGAIEYGPFAIRHDATGSIAAEGGKQIAIFPNVHAGLMALNALLENYLGMNVANVLQKYTGLSGANLEAYTSGIAKSLGGSSPDLFSGIKNHPILRMPPMPAMAAPNLMARNVTNHIGTITINTQATDPKKMAADFGRGTDWLTFASQANGAAV